MKKSFVALSVLSGIFLASSAMAAPSQWVGLPMDTTASFDIKETVAIEFGATAPKEFTYLNEGDEVFRLEVTAPENVKVAIAGKGNAMYNTPGYLMQDGGVSVSDASNIIVRPDDSSLLTNDTAYLPSGAATGNSVMLVIVDGSNNGKTSIPFVSSSEYKMPPAGTYNYTFVAQAFVE